MSGRTIFCDYTPVSATEDLRPRVAASVATPDVSAADADLEQYSFLDAPCWEEESTDNMKKGGLANDQETALMVLGLPTWCSPIVCLNLLFGNDKVLLDDEFCLAIKQAVEQSSGSLGAEEADEQYLKRYTEWREQLWNHIQAQPESDRVPPGVKLCRKSDHRAGDLETLPPSSVRETHLGGAPREVGMSALRGGVRPAGLLTPYNGNVSTGARVEVDFEKVDGIIFYKTIPRSCLVCLRMSARQG